MIISPENFRDEELTVPLDKLEDAGVSVTVAGPTPGEYKGMLGMSLTPDVLVADADASEYDAVIVVGGSGTPQHLWNNEEVLNLLHEADEQGKVVAGICLAGAVLANAGVLDGKDATVFPSPEAVEALEQGGANYRKLEVVVDGRTVTAEGPEHALEFANEIIKALGVKAFI